MKKDTDKDEYIIKSLASIGKRKKWELYVVTRIIHLLKNNDLEFTCQQYVKQKDLDGYFFTDLCFPSLDLYIEVNEMQHDDSKEADKKRQRAIHAATSWEQLDIDIYEYHGDAKVYKSLEDINEIIDGIVSKIEKKKEKLIAKGEAVTWDYGKKYDPATYKKRNNGIIHVKHNVVFRYMKDAMALFGRKETYTPWEGSFEIERTNEWVWCPKLYDYKERNGIIWKNSFTENEQKITMRKEKNGELVEVPEALNRAIVFAHQKNLLGQVEYRFFGVFEPSFKESDPYKNVYSRVEEEIDLTKYS